MAQPIDISRPMPEENSGPPVSDIVAASPVQTMPVQTPAAPPQNAAPQVAQVKSGHRFFSKKAMLITLVVILLLIAGGVGLYLYFTQPTTDQSAVAPPAKTGSTAQSAANSDTDQQLNSDLSSVDSGLGSAGSDLSGANQGISDQQPDLSQ
jgi:hypothetical protein